jgi:replication factor C large subunit
MSIWIQEAMDMFIEKYRPTTLKDFIGSQDIIRASQKWAEAWFNGKALLPYLILHGKSGIGKTTLSHCLAEHYGCAISELNASDERNVGAIKQAIQTNGMTNILGSSKRRLTILDEADHLTKASQLILASKSKLLKNPVILLVNDLERIIPELQKLSIKIQMREPTNQQKLLLAKDIIAKEGLQPWNLKEIILSSRSFRDLINNLYCDTYGDDYKDDFEGDHLELIGAMMKGEVSSERLKMTPEEVLRFVYQNDIHSYLRDIDLWLTLAKRSGNYRMWAHSFAVMELQRFRGLIRKPKNEFKAKNKPKKADKKTEKPSLKIQKVKPQKVGKVEVKNSLLNLV